MPVGAVVGWAAGVDRLVLLSQLTPQPPVLPVGVLPLPDGDSESGSASAASAVDKATLQVAEALRCNGVAAVGDWMPRKLSAKLKVRMACIFTSITL